MLDTIETEPRRVPKLRKLAMAATLVSFLTFSTRAQANDPGTVARKERDPAGIVRQMARGGFGPLVDVEGCLMLPENGLYNRASEASLLSLAVTETVRSGEPGFDLSSLDLSAYDTREEIQAALGRLLESRGIADPPEGDSYSPSHHVDFYDWDGDGDLDAFVGLKSLNNTDDNRGPIPVPPGSSLGLGSLMYFENVTGEEDSPFPEDYPYFVPRLDEGPLRSFSKDFQEQAFLGSPAPRLADLDGDAIPELYVGLQNGKVLRFLVNGDEAAERGLPYDPGDDVFSTFGEYLQIQVDERGSLEDLDVGENAVPAFFDQDGDGTVELFVGHKASEFLVRGGPPPDWEPVYMFGSLPPLPDRGAALPLVWEQADPEDNPFAGQEVAGYTAPVFTDIDGDLDEDAFVGAKTGLHYFENVTGEAVRGLLSPAVFIQQFGTDHPLLGAQTLLHGTAPAFADIEGDGDLDYFAGGKTINFVENRGSASDPAFLDMGYSTEFADLDGDGDLDALAGGKLLRPFSEIGGTRGSGFLDLPDLVYFENVGTSLDPVWERRLDENSPVAGLLADAGFELEPDSEIAADLVDIDGDGDLDLFVGTKDDGLQFFRNVGDPQNPVFVLELSPFAAYNDPAPESGDKEFPEGGFLSSPDPFFVDLDGDGDYDAVIGNKADDDGVLDGSDVALRYFENVTGESRGSGLVFEERTGKDNPFDLLGPYFFGIDDFEVAAPWLVDYDHDGDYDLFVGSKGEVLYFENVGDDENPSFDPEPATAFWLSRLPELLDEFLLRGDSLGDFLTESDFPSLGFWHFTERATPAVVDIDGDGDYDGFVGAVGINEAFRAPSGIVVEQVPVVTSEAGDSQILMVSLKSKPPIDVTVEIEVTDGTEASLSTSSLEFTPENWDTPQPVTVTGLPDALVDGDIAYQVVFSAIYANDPRGREEPCAVLPVEAINLDDEARAAALVATKEVFGPNTMPGDVVTYVIEVTNVSDVTQSDLMGPEFEDTLPPELMLLSADADSGAASTFGNTVSWNGSLAPGATVRITVTAEILDVPGGTEVVNQGTAFFDGEEGGTGNDAMVLSDDPNLPGIADETRFIVGEPIGSASVLEIPTLSQVGSWAMGALLALFALVGISRHRP